MAAKKDYYEILGISRNASENEIKKAYRGLAKKYHPDSNKGNPQAEKRFQEITEAYTVLSDKEKRKLYDEFGSSAFSGQGASQEGGFGGPFQRGGYREYHFEGGDMDDILKDFFGGFGGGRFTGGGRGQRGFSQEDFFGGRAYGGSPRGEDLETEVTISFEEAAFGCEKLLKLSTGEGSQTLKVRIPAGIDTGKTVRLRGKGGPGLRGGEPGDLLLRVKVSDKEGYERRGADVYTTVNVPFPTAVLGGEIKVGTLYGDVLCSLKEGTQSGTRIRLRGKGIVSMTDPKKRGDQYVTIQIQVPKSLSLRARQKLMEYQAALQEGQSRRF
ncbi:MAG: DnaJ C-terminal domain-containing protein [Eubacteriales bacterium]|nr:DnaJ C-terminal domain-containing protein [Eubacteriales bacterium]